MKNTPENLLLGLGKVFAHLHDLGLLLGFVFELGGQDTIALLFHTMLVGIRAKRAIYNRHWVEGRGQRGFGGTGPLGRQ